jgi:hypothetical protein
MSRRIDPASQVVQFFSEAPLDQAATVLAIVKGILARRQPKTKPAKPTRKPNGAAVAEPVPAHIRTTKGGLVLEEPDRP